MRTIAIALFTLAGCIDEFHGSNVQIDFAKDVPVQASAFGPAAAGELPSNIHFTLYAFDETLDPATNVVVGRLFEVQRFEIHRIVDLNSPCFIDVGEHVPIEGLHVSQYAEEIKKQKGIDDVANPPASASEQDKIDVATAIRRQQLVEEMAGAIRGPKAVTSAATGGYPAVAADCNDTSAIPPTTCVDEASNQRRLEKCRAAWENDEELFEGTDRVLTLPLSGTTYGFVHGENPANLAPIGGAGFFVDENLDRFEGFAIYWQYDDANRDGAPDYPPTVPASEREDLGTLFLFGRPDTHVTRGVIHTHMTNMVDPLISAELAIFANIDDDDVHF